MAWPDKLQPMSLPVIGAPLFIISNPQLVLAQCKNGVIGAFPALNARPELVLDAWLSQITSELAAFRKANPGAEVAPFAVNQIIHASNDTISIFARNIKCQLSSPAFRRRPKSFPACILGAGWSSMMSSACAMRKKPSRQASMG
jgi:NAD(P)H-dependent flavin oxidoreductase YrpB (nitropropane dioxygenase family)